MSTRHLRRVYGNDVISKDEHDDTSDVEPITRDGKLKSFNVFNLLNEKFECEAIDDNENETAVEHEEIDNDKCSKKKKKKKKKIEKSSKIQNIAKSENLEDFESTDEIERTVKEVNKLLGEPAPCSSKIQDTNSYKIRDNILVVQHKYLNATNELRRICGSKIGLGENKNNRGRSRVGLKKIWLTSHTDWFPSAKFGLSMVIDNTIKSTDGVQYFIFIHSAYYRQIQMKFFDAVESQNPENIVNILNTHPCNVDALLQFADLCKVNEDLQMSAEFVERAVYYLECAFHPLFNITSSYCRLSYKHQANRALFIALFKHLMFIGGRACNRTSLELCKFLMSLDPDDDPLAIILAIDFYAMRAREYQWFIDFCQYWEEKKNLTQLPNIAYSLALANFHVGNLDVANELLQNALIMFPGVLLNLLDKCGVETDTKVLGHDHFGLRAKNTTSVALEKLQDLYVFRSYHLWKESTNMSILPWLESAVHTVMDRIDAGDEFTKFCELKRIKRYQGKPPRNVLRHIILSDMKEVTINHPGIHNEGVIFSYDPLPPTDSVDIYSKREIVHRSTQQNTNLFSLFVSSLFTDPNSTVAGDAGALNHINNVREDPPEEFD
ncbi:hypothetical protein PV327_002980 [Microctonus hyperodae]|uniref:Transcription factor 25 n=1 Tax=Microctonus hyperodae TaxID=165561 RepID=A0AA39G321_MICHY|nr:hypothetical protein PV327_002980 [Microctonus hyperodae]